MEIPFYNKLEPKDRKILCGISFVLFGVLYLLKALDLLSPDNPLLNYKAFPLYLAAIFLYGKDTKVAAVFGIIALIVWIPTIADYIGQFAHLFGPLLLIGIGVLLITSVKKKGIEDQTSTGNTIQQNIDNDTTTVEVEEINDDDKDD